MPAAEFFNQLGILTVRNFLDRDVCTRICTELRKSRLIKGRHKGEEMHRTVSDADFTGPRLVVEPPATILAPIEAAFQDYLPALEKQFSVNLSRIEPPSFVVYHKDCAFKRHVDAVPNAALASATRQVSVILYLNQETEYPPPEGSYSGGNLTFYGLMPDPAFAQVGLPLTGDKAMLVAFQPTVWHEVTPVTGGERYVAVGWYH